MINCSSCSKLGDGSPEIPTAGKWLVTLAGAAAIGAIAYGALKKPRRRVKYRDVEVYQGRGRRRFVRVHS